MRFLEEHNFKIIASADFDYETFCYDGIIVARNKNFKGVGYTNLGNRSIYKR